MAGAYGPGHCGLSVCGNNLYNQLRCSMRWLCLIVCGLCLIGCHYDNLINVDLRRQVVDNPPSDVQSADEIAADAAASVDKILKR